MAVLSTLCLVPICVSSVIRRNSEGRGLKKQWFGSTLKNNKHGNYCRKGLHKNSSHAK